MADDGAEKATAAKRRQYDYRLPVRMTRQERAAIGRKAQANSLSVSRYLVASALEENGLTPEERSRLLRLRDYFGAAAGRLRQLSALPAFREGEGGQALLAATRLREALSVLEALTDELDKRLQDGRPQG